MGKIRRFITVTLSLFAVITTLSGCERTKQTSEKKLVEKMGGNITFESESGVGTTFVITIPFKINS